MDKFKDMSGVDHETLMVRMCMAEYIVVDNADRKSRLPVSLNDFVHLIDLDAYRQRLCFTLPQTCATVNRQSVARRYQRRGPSWHRRIDSTPPKVGTGGDILGDSLPRVADVYVSINDKTLTRFPKSSVWSEANREFSRLSRLGGRQLPFHRAPLPSRIAGIDNGEKDDCDCRKSSNASAVFIRFHEKPDDTPPECYERPHHVLAVLLGVAGGLCLGLACRFWDTARRCISDGRQAFLGWMGLVALIARFWFIYHAFGLFESQVAPCAG